MSLRGRGSHYEYFCQFCENERGSRQRGTVPKADIVDKEVFVCRESVRIEARRVLVEPQNLVSQPVDTDNHRGRHVGRLEGLTPLRDQLTVTGEHDCLGRIGRYTVTWRPPS